MSITDFRKDLFGVIEQTIRFNEPVTISTKEGNAVILSEEDYNGLMGTLYLSSVPGIKESAVEGLNTPVSECMSEKEVKW